MEIKTKILKILPYWLTALAVLVTAQVGASLLANKSARSSKDLANETGKPQVLGVTSIRGSGVRGEPVLEKASLEKISEPDLSDISAKSFLVFNLADGQNLVEKNSSAKLGIASLTKLLTGLVAYQMDDLNKSFVVSKKDVLNVSPSLGLKSG
ncbi:MAG TPA: hypothetical protein VE973_03130, partial [Candidatus Limnocylindria bacterium]|nr:hypothetical protein [Candidatus Limnocylindria bacterium]